MIVDERLVTYINSLDTGNTSILDQIEQEALDSYVPIHKERDAAVFKAASCNKTSDADP